MTIINYTSSGVNKLKASLNDDARVVIYDRHMFIVLATGLQFKSKLLALLWNIRQGGGEVIDIDKRPTLLPYLIIYNCKPF